MHKRIALLLVVVLAAGAALAQELVTLPPEQVTSTAADLTAQFYVAGVQVLTNSTFSSDPGQDNWLPVPVGIERERAPRTATIECDDTYPLDGKAARVSYATETTGLTGIAFEQKITGTAVPRMEAPLLNYWIRYQYDRGTSDAVARGGFVGVVLYSDGRTYELRYYHGVSTTPKPPEDTAGVHNVDGRSVKREAWSRGVAEPGFWDVRQDAFDAFGISDFTVRAVRIGVILYKTRDTRSHLHFLFDNVELVEGARVWHEYRLVSEDTWQQAEARSCVGRGSYTATVEGLIPSSAYITRAALSYLGQTIYGNEVTFMTSGEGHREEAEPLEICSFNVKWLGHYTRRDNEALSSLLSGYDIVVVQELVAPPYEHTFPDGTPTKPDDEARAFFDSMRKHGFAYWLSEEDTGQDATIHTNGTGSEWWVAFYKPEVVQTASDLPHGFLAAERAANQDYDRVPYAFSFRTLCGALDFVLISVHLKEGDSSSDVQRRSAEIRSIAQWIVERETCEKDYLILGDMNIWDRTELATFVPRPFESLNLECVATNTSPTNPRPYDHVLFDRIHTAEMDTLYGFRVIALVDEMHSSWSKSGTYPGNPYDADLFPQYYSDHNPFVFRLLIPNHDDD